MAQNLRNTHTMRHAQFIRLEIDSKDAQNKSSAGAGMSRELLQCVGAIQSSQVLASDAPIDGIGRNLCFGLHENPRAEKQTPMSGRLSAAHASK
eukprot:6176927-Pleurochrysis_carterae.AAC.2